MFKYKTIERYRAIRAALDALDAGYSLRQVAKASGVPITTLWEAKKGRCRWVFEEKTA